MSKVALLLTLSLDGYINDEHGRVDRLFADPEALRPTELLQGSINRTGAVVMGRHAYAMGDPDAFADNYEYQVPIFVLTHTAPERRPKENDRLRFTFVADGIDSAIAQARAAGDKDVTVIGGASTAQQCIQARLLDELHIGLVPVLFGDGLRPFGRIGWGTWSWNACKLSSRRRAQTCDSACSRERRLIGKRGATERREPA